MLKEKTLFIFVIFAFFISEAISASGHRFARSPGKMEVETPDNSGKLGDRGGELESEAEDEDDYWDQDRQKKEGLNKKNKGEEPESPENGPYEPSEQSDNGDDEQNELPINGDEATVDEPTSTDINIENQDTVTEPNQISDEQTPGDGPYEPSQQSAGDDDNGRIDVDEDVNNKSERYEDKGGEKAQNRQEEYENNNYQRPTVSYE